MKSLRQGHFRRQWRIYDSDIIPLHERFHVWPTIIPTWHQTRLDYFSFRSLPISLATGGRQCPINTPLFDHDGSIVVTWICVPANIAPTSLCIDPTSFRHASVQYHSDMHRSDIIPTCISSTSFRHASVRHHSDMHQYDMHQSDIIPTCISPTSFRHASVRHASVRNHSDMHQSDIIPTCISTTCISPTSLRHASVRQHSDMQYNPTISQQTCSNKFTNCIVKCQCISHRLNFGTSRCNIAAMHHHRSTASSYAKLPRYINVFRWRGSPWNGRLNSYTYVYLRVNVVLQWHNCLI